MKTVTYFLLPALLASSGFSLLKAQNYTFQVVECGADSLPPTAMNTRGVVVGGAEEAGSVYSLGLIYFNGACQTLRPPAGGLAFSGISDNGALFGTYTARSQTRFMLDEGVARALPPYPGADA